MKTQKGNLNNKTTLKQQPKNKSKSMKTQNIKIADKAESQTITKYKSTPMKTGNVNIADKAISHNITLNKFTPMKIQNEIADKTTTQTYNPKHITQNKSITMKMQKEKSGTIIIDKSSDIQPHKPTSQAITQNKTRAMKKEVKKSCIWLIGGALLSTSIYAQNVGINATGNPPNNSAMLDIDVSGMTPQKGLLIPRVSLNSNTDVTTIPNPAHSLVVYNTNPNMTNGNGEGFYYWDAAAGKWMYMATASNGPGTAGQVLTSTGPGSKPQWSTLSVSGGGGSTGCANCISMISSYDPNIYTWAGCREKCRNLTEGGYTDWRMPTMDEALQYAAGLMDPPGNTWYSNWVWTATPAYYNLTGSSSTNSYWLVFHESNGYWYWYNYSNNYYCRCVR